LKELVQIVELFEIHFLGVRTQHSQKVSRIFMATLSDEEIKNGRTELEAFLHRNLQTYMTLLKSIANPLDNIDENCPESILEIIDEITKEVELHTVLKSYSVSNVLDELCRTWISKITHNSFDYVVNTLLDRLEDELESKCGDESTLRNFIQELEGSIVNDLTTKCLEAVKGMTSTSSSFLKSRPDLFEGLSKEGLNNFWDTLIKNMTSKAENIVDITKSSTVLAMSRIISDCHSTLSDRVYIIYSNEIYPSASRNSSQLQNSSTTSSNSQLQGTPFASDAALATEKLKLGAEQLLSRYLEIVGWELSSWIRLEYDNNATNLNWLNKKVPVGPSKLWVGILSQIRTVENQSALMFPEMAADIRNKSDNYAQSRNMRGHRYTGSTSSISSQTSRGHQSRLSALDIGATRQMMSNIDKLFIDKIEYYGKVEPSGVGILTVIIRIIVKTWIESVRSYTFGRNGFQQVQVDVEWLKWQMKYLKPERSIVLLLEEVTTSCYRRCIEPVFMDRPNVEKLAGIQDVMESGE